jgi:hypothetical protein
MIGTRLGLETGQYRLVHRLFDGLSSERECTPRDLDVIPAAGASCERPLSLDKFAFARDALMRFVGALDAILALAVTWKPLGHFENTTWHKPTNCRVDDNDISNLEFV